MSPHHLLPRDRAIEEMIINLVESPKPNDKNMTQSPAAAWRLKSLVTTDKTPTINKELNFGIDKILLEN